MTDFRSDDAPGNRTAVAERAARAGAQVALESFRSGLAVETKSGKTDLVTQADRDAQERVSEVIEEARPRETIVGEEGNAPKTVPNEGPSWVIDPIDGTNNYVRGVPLWTTSVAAVVDGDPVAAANVMPALEDAYVAGTNGHGTAGEAAAGEPGVDAETDSGVTTLNAAPVSVSDRSDPAATTVALTAWQGTDRPDAYTALVGELAVRFGDFRRFGSAQTTLSYVASGALDAVFTNLDPNPWDTLAGVYLIRRAGGRVTDLDGEPWTGRGGFVASNGREPVHEEALAAAQVIRDR